MNWAGLVIGILVLISPWVLGFGASVMMWANTVFGVALVLIHGSALVEKHHKSP